jgi:hypothetical protein
VGVRRTKLGTKAGADRYLVLNAVAASAGASSRTIEIDTSGGWERLVLQIEYTQSAGSAVVVTPTYSLDGGTTYCQLTSTSVAAGAGTVSDYVDTHASGASENFGLAYDVAGYDKFKIVFSVTGGGASDLLSVLATLVAS